MGEVDDNDEETAQSEVQSAGSNRSDPGREDAESVGIAVQGASDPDCEVAQVGTEHLPELFVDGRTRQNNTSQAETDALYEQIGRLKVELDWLKTKVGMLD